MADMICIVLSVKNLHNPDCSNSGQSWFFVLLIRKLQWKSTGKGNTSLIILFTKGQIR